MKPLLFILIPLLSIGVFAQKAITITDSLFQSAPELSIEKGISDSLFSKVFHCFTGNIHGWNQYKLKKNGTYDYINEGYFSYNGTWKIKNETHELVFVSKEKGKQNFYLIRYINYLYLIPSAEVFSFISDFHLRKQEHKGAKPFVLEDGGKEYTFTDLIARDISIGRFWIFE